MWESHGFPRTCIGTAHLKQELISQLETFEKVTEALDAQVSQLTEFILKQIVHQDCKQTQVKKSDKLFTGSPHTKKIGYKIQQPEGYFTGELATSVQVEKEKW